VRVKGGEPAIPHDVRHGHVDQALFPHVQEIDTLQLTQEEGDVIFVPAGWYHQVLSINRILHFVFTLSKCNTSLQVRNLGRAEDVTTGATHTSALTISVNRNWFNGFNIFYVWRFLLKEREAVLRAIDSAEFSDTESYWRHLDIVMRANSALSMTDFIRCATELVLMRT
jgi:hypothetical protein